MRGVLLAVLLLASCRGAEDDVVAPFTVTIRDTAGAVLLTAQESPQGEVALAVGSRQLKAVEKESGKRKYAIDGGAVAFEIKPGEGDDFKLRRADGSLRWKVKVADDKITVSDNEQNENPFELKLREGDRIKVVAPGERRLGDVRGNTIENAAGAKLYTVEGPAGAAGYGVLLLDAIPIEERAILLAELLSRRR